MNDIEKKYKALLKVFNSMSNIADQAIVLADQYAGGDSETAKALSKQFEKVDKAFNKLTKPT